MMDTGVEEKKNVTVRIFGNEYPLAGVKNPAYMEELARYVDTKMNDVAKGSALLSSGKIAVLAALNMADELHRLREGKEILQSRALAKLGALAKKIDDHFQKS